MRNVRTPLPLLLALTLLLAGRAAAAPPAASPPSPVEEAICPVCRLHEGESEPEEVRATAVFEGKTYGLCSDECKRAFEEDPLAYLPPVLPRPAPDFTGRRLDGTRAGLAAYSGRVVLLDFWATWCQPCVSAMPRLQALHDRHAEGGFTLLGVSIDDARSEKKVRKLLAERRVRYPVLLDAGSAAPAWAAFHVRAIPAMFLIDARGQVVAQWQGEVPLAEVEAAVGRLLAGGAPSAGGGG